MWVFSNNIFLQVTFYDWTNGREWQYFIIRSVLFSLLFSLQYINSSVIQQIFPYATFRHATVNSITVTILLYFPIVIQYDVNIFNVSYETTPTFFRVSRWTLMAISVLSLSGNICNSEGSSIDWVLNCNTYSRVIMTHIADLHLIW